MELTWLEDFLALAEHRNFSRAAAARNVTQPAFSRRIQALEAWIGTPLVRRGPQGVQLAAAGLDLRDKAAALVRDIQAARRGALQAAGRDGAALCIAATHALSFTFLPGWIRGLFPLEAPGPLNLVADSMAACERLFAAGEADFLLAHAQGEGSARLPPGDFPSIVVGQDLLVPVSAPLADGTPRWPLPERPGVPVRALAYSAASGLGRLLEAALAGRVVLEAAVTAPLAAALQTLARQGQGMAWLPRSLLAEDLAAGRLVPAGPDFAVPVEIRLFRPRRGRSAAAEGFWQRAVAALAAAEPVPVPERPSIKE